VRFAARVEMSELGAHGWSLSPRNRSRVARVTSS
jgi:hypothetical protein